MKDRKVQRRAVVVGLNQWDDARIQPLRCAERDARAMGLFFSSIGFDHVELLLGSEAGANAVMTEVESQVRILSENDLMVFYFAGHGRLERGKYYLMCRDGRSDGFEIDHPSGYLGLHGISNLMKKTSACHRLFICDACRTSRIAGRSSESSRFGAAQSMRDLVTASRKGKGVEVILNSCEDDQLAVELENHGLFTQAFLDICQTKREQSKEIRIDGALKSILGDRMQQLGDPKHQQWPLLFEGRPLPYALHENLVKKADSVSQPPSRKEISYWHVYDGGEERGTINEADLLDKIREGNISRTAELWQTGMTEWKAITEIEKFKIHFAPQRQKISVVNLQTPPLRRPTGPKEGEDWMIPELGLELVWLHPGTVVMENNTTVEITRGFWLGKYPVTQGEYQRILGHNPSHFKNCGERAPVEQVSWKDANAFCEKLNQMERESKRLPSTYGYALPSEAQWEYGCRAGSTGEYCYGDSESQLSNYAWYEQNSGRNTHSVGGKEPNNWGLYDMHGNVWEWCEDACEFFGSLPGGEHMDLLNTEGSGRVNRGGCWGVSAGGCRCSCRIRSVPDSRDCDLGFRLALRSFS